MGILEDILKALDRIPNWKRIQTAPQAIDALEQRIKALEAKLKPPTGEQCPSCGAMAYKLTRSTPSPEPWGSMGARQDHYQCSACQYQDTVERNPS
jgi:hypothetical protein